MQRPGAQATHEERVAKLHLACGGVGKIPERSIERLDAGGGAGIDHFRNGVVPEILLERRAWLVAFGVSKHFVFGMAAPDARGLHRPRDAARSAGPRLIPCIRGEAVAISSTLLTPCAVSRMAWMRIGFFSLCRAFELRQQLIEIVDVPWPIDLGQHDHVELVADGADDFGDVVECPRRIERVDTRP